MASPGARSSSDPGSSSALGSTGAAANTHSVAAQMSMEWLASPPGDSGANGASAPNLAMQHPGRRA